MEKMDINLTLRNAVELVNIPWRNNNFSLVESEAPLSEHGAIFVGAYLLLLCWLSCVGNSIMILVLHRQRCVLQPIDLLMLNLAISDMAIAVFGYSRGIVKVFNIFRDGGYVLTRIWTCQVNGFLTLLFGLSTINTLTVMSVTRYLRGHDSNKANSMSRGIIHISIICIWMGALFWSMAPLLGWGSYTDHGYGICDVDWSKANRSTTYKSFLISILTSCFIIPALVMLSTYISTLHMIKSRNIMSLEGYSSQRQRNVERDMTRVSIAISTAFLVAWSPYAITCMHSAWGLHVPSAASNFTCLWAKSACFYNPFIYLAMSSKFRGDLADLVPGSGGTQGTIRLLLFKPKAEPVSVVSLSPLLGEVNQSNLELLTEDKDFRANNLLNTPPLLSKGHFDVRLHKDSDLTEYESIRL